MQTELQCTKKCSRNKQDSTRCHSHPVLSFFCVWRYALNTKKGAQGPLSRSGFGPIMGSGPGNLGSSGCSIPTEEPGT